MHIQKLKMNERTRWSLEIVTLDMLWVLSCVGFVLYWVLSVSPIGGPKAASLFVVLWTVLILPLLLATLRYQKRTGVGGPRWCLNTALVSWFILVSLAIYFFAVDVPDPMVQPRLLDIMAVHALAVLVFVISLTVYMVRTLKLPQTMNHRS